MKRDLLFQNFLHGKAVSSTQQIDNCVIFLGKELFKWPTGQRILQQRHGHCCQSWLEEIFPLGINGLQFRNEGNQSRDCLTPRRTSISSAGVHSESEVRLLYQFDWGDPFIASSNGNLYTQPLALFKTKSEVRIWKFLNAFAQRGTNLVTLERRWWSTGRVETDPA